MIDPTTKVMTPDPDGDAKRMSDAQAAELRQLCEEQDEPFDDALSAHEADRRIATLKELRDH